MIFKHIKNPYSYPFLERGQADEMLSLLAAITIEFLNGGTCAVYRMDFTVYESKVKPQSCELIDIGFNLLMTGRPNTYLIPAIEYALFKQIKSPHISNETIAELVLIKSFFIYFCNNDFNFLLHIFETYCSSDILIQIINELENLLKPLN